MGSVKYTKQLNGYQGGTQIAPTYRLNLRSKPTTNSKVLTILDKGQQLVVGSDETNRANGYLWQKVKTSDKGRNSFLSKG